MPARSLALALACIVLAVVPEGCHRGDCSAGWVPEVFANFIYVGQFPDNRKEPIPEHDQEALPLPRQFQKKTAYIFHSKGPVSAEAVAIKDLPQRLKTARVQIVSGPENPGEFGVPNSGGPIWSIRFTSDGCKGEIYNTVDQTLYHDRKTWPDGSREDYILVFSE